MKTMRLVIGIICVVLTLVIMFQSCVAGLGNALSDSGEMSGSAGIVLSIVLLISGIIGIAGRKSNGATITAAVFFILGLLISQTSIGSFTDLKIWSYMSIIFGVLFIISFPSREG